MNPWDQFSGANAGYVYELFERYQRDPSSVDEATRRAFATWPADAHPDSGELRRGPTVAPSGREGGDSVDAAIAVHTLAESIRRFGAVSPQAL